MSVTQRSFSVTQQLTWRLRWVEATAEDAVGESRSRLPQAAE
jgi:hypothetical protein